MSKAKPTYMRPVLEDAISKGAFTRDARKAARWALVTIDDLTARLAAAEAELNNVADAIGTIRLDVAIGAFQKDSLRDVIVHIDRFLKAAKGKRNEM